MKKPKKFRSFKVYRYLVGSVQKQVMVIDLKEYNKHRYKVFTAEPKVDNKPPKLNPYTYVDERKLSTDAQRLKEIDKQNKELLRKINIINRTTGRVDSFNPHAYDRATKWQSHAFKIKIIEQNNKEIYKSILSAKSDYSKAYMNQYWKDTVEKIKSSAKFPFTIFNKISIDQKLLAQPSISGGLEKVAERPLCFLEFRVKKGPLLGRIIVELYYDHVPVTVQNFLSLICGDDKNMSYKNCMVHRIIPGLYLETGDITEGTGKGGMSIYGKYFSEENHVLKHTRTGVLSMIRVGNQENNSQFCITFSKIEQLDKRNVVFGKIIKGNDNLMKIQGYGRRIGKPLAEIMISNCGKI